MADKAHKATDERLEQMERHLSAIYSRAEKEIGKAWKEYLTESGKQIEDLQKTYDEAKKSGDRAAIKKAGYNLSKVKQQRTLHDKRFRDLSKQTAEQLLHVNETALAYINGELPEAYSLGYNALEPAVENLGGYSFTLTDPDTVRNLATSDASLLPTKAMDARKDIAWNTKKLNAEVLQGILLGESMDKIAGRLSKVEDMNATAAIRNARTMVTGAENKGRQDSYERATKDGVIMKREWISTNDGRTRHSHRLLDGQIAEVDKPFNSELGEIMFPGDPHAHPANIYNCRCTLVAKIVGFAKNLSNKTEREALFTEEEINSLKEYTLSFYSGINSYLRGNSESTPDIIEIIKNVDSAMGKSKIKESSHLFRGTSIDELKMFNPEKRMSWFEKMKNLKSLEGESVTVPSYISTSKDEVLSQYKSGVEIEFITDGEINGIDISGFSAQSTERETLVDRSTEMEIIKIEADYDAEGYVEGTIKIFAKLRKRRINER